MNRVLIVIMFLIMRVLWSSSAKPPDDNSNKIIDETTEEETLKSKPQSGSVYAAQGNRRSGNRIVGGHKATDTMFPYAVRITYPKRSNITTWCTGSLITKQHVLFAEHCVYAITEEDAKTLWFHLGSSKASVHNQERGVLEIYSHPHYGPISNDHDIAIAKMDAPVEFTDKIKKIDLPPYVHKCSNLSSSSSDLKPGRNVIAVGWGQLSQNEGGISSKDLMYVNLQILDHEKCKQKYASCVTKENGKCRFVRDSHICTYTKNKDACSGDSGGPLIRRNGYRFWQVGVISWGEGCAKEYPGVYTDVGKHMDFINDVINN